MTATELRRIDLIDTIARLEHDQRNLRTWARREDNTAEQADEIRETWAKNQIRLKELRSELATLDQAVV